jgi:hypothetical protein
VDRNLIASGLASGDAAVLDRAIGYAAGRPMRPRVSKCLKARAVRLEPLSRAGDLESLPRTASCGTELVVALAACLCSKDVTDGYGRQRK